MAMAVAAAAAVVVVGVVVGTLKLELFEQQPVEIKPEATVAGLVDAGAFLAVDTRHYNKNRRC